MNNSNDSQPAFCCTLLKDGKTSKIESADAKEFPLLINSGVVSWIDISVQDFSEQTKQIATSLGFSESFISDLFKNTKSNYKDIDSEMGLIIPAITVDKFVVKLNPLAILIKDNLVLTIHTHEAQRFVRLRRYAESFIGKLKSKAKKEDNLTFILIRIIDENNSRNFDHLRDIEQVSDDISGRLANPKFPRLTLSEDIYKMKHSLIVYLSGLWTTINVLDSLRYGDPILLSDNPKILEKLSMVINNVNSQINVAEYLSSVLSSGFEVLQSIYNNQLQILNNKIALLMAYLTIIGTAVLVPNTLATVLGSSVFGLAVKDQNWYVGIILVSTVVATIGSYIWVKRSGLLPEKAE